jgi:hypothetical protein
MRTISSSISAATAMLVLLSAGCASGPTVRVDTQADKDPGPAIEAAVVKYSPGFRMERGNDHACS